MHGEDYLYGVGRLHISIFFVVFCCIRKKLVPLLLLRDLKQHMNYAVMTSL